VFTRAFRLIRDGIDGLLVPPSDAISWRRRRHPDGRCRSAAAPRPATQGVLEKYDLNHNVMSLAEVFRQRLGRVCMRRSVVSTLLVALGYTLLPIADASPSATHFIVKPGGDRRYWRIGVNLGT
jgi:hypothetical protein